MAQHVDILEDREPLGRSFAGSLAFHIALAGIIAGAGVVRSSTSIKLGSPDAGGGIGSVAITPVNTIPLPSTDAPRNPVAKDTRSQVPEEKVLPKQAPKKAAPPPKKEDPNALVVKGGYTLKKYAQSNKFREQQQDKPNQLYSQSGQRLSSDMFAMQGSGRIGLGDNSPFGNQFGAYAKVLRDRVAAAWNTAGIEARVRSAPVVVVTFTLNRNGSISGLRMTSSSGIGALDRSALRAIQDASPFPPVPPQFPKDRTDIDFVFELQR